MSAEKAFAIEAGLAGGLDADEEDEFHARSQAVAGGSAGMGVPVLGFFESAICRRALMRQRLAAAGSGFL